MKCLYCQKEIDPKEWEEMEKNGIEPLCSEYCYNVYSGVPMPWSGVEYFEIEQKYAKLREDKGIPIPLPWSDKEYFEIEQKYSKLNEDNCEKYKLNKGYRYEHY